LIRDLEIAAKKLLATGQPLLIHGETGTGKGVMARWFHQHSPRRDKACIDIGCAGLDPGALVAELFGYEQAAGLTKAGLFELAHQGLVFLDEVGDLPPLVERRLCELLEEGSVCREGDPCRRPVDVRLVMATHGQLDRLVDGPRRALWGRFQALRLPSLRKRPEDIPYLAAILLRRLKKAEDAPKLSSAAIRRLCRHPWPGNIRELKNVLERSLLLGGSTEISPQDLLFDIFEA
jgi:DNA-binding NtrC family response regulator